MFKNFYRKICCFLNTLNCQPETAAIGYPRQIGGFMRLRVNRLPFFRAGRVSLLSVWVASFALLFQTILPLTYRPAAANPAAIDGEMVICTAHGLAMAPEADGAPDTDSNSLAGKTLKCPLCQVWHSLGSALPASASNILGPIYTAAQEIAVFAQAEPARFHLDPLQARAPPLMA